MNTSYYVLLCNAAYQSILKISKLIKEIRMFMGAMMLIVLPIFFVVSARMVAKNEMGDTIGGKVVEMFLYVCTGFCAIGLIILLASMAN